MIIGIDFGTCFSSIAVMQGLRPVDNIVDDYEQRYANTSLGIPTLFMFSDDEGKELYGINCLKANPTENPEVIKYMKRKVREDPENIDRPCPSGGNEYLLRDVIEKYVSYLIKTVKESAISNGNFDNTDIEAMTITTPIGISSGQMMATDYNRLIKETMVNITGLPDKDVHIIAEPVAAAISYLYESDLKKKIDQEQTIMVIDLGGGTLDVTVVKHNPFAMTYDIVSKEGDLELGGMDWDHALGQLIMDRIGIASIEDPIERGAFWEEMTGLKISLSQRDNDVRILNIGGKRYYGECTREEFENATSALLSRAAEVVRRSVSDIDGGISSIDKIVLVGGSSNMPQITKMLATEFPDFDSENILVYRPSKAIARGAAIYAKLNLSHGSFLPDGPRIRDCTAYSYGFESHHNGSDELSIYNGILKGDKFDENRRIHFKSSSFIPRDNSQNAVTFTIYESQWNGANSVPGPNKQLNEEEDDEEYRWMPMGSGETPNGMEVTVQVPPEYLGRARQYSVWVIFDLDQDGILDITIVDRNDKKVGFVTNHL